MYNFRTIETTKNKEKPNYGIGVTRKNTIIKLPISEPNQIMPINFNYDESVNDFVNVAVGKQCLIVVYTTLK